jgi:hypothetical protein
VKSVLVFLAEFVDEIITVIFLNTYSVFSKEMHKVSLENVSFAIDIYHVEGSA